MTYYHVNTVVLSGLQLSFVKCLSTRSVVNPQLRVATLDDEC